MEVKGKIIHDLGETSGIAQASGNAWKKHEYVLETIEQRPRKIHFDFFGDRADQFPLAIGDDVTLSFDIESREYQGRWYTSIRGWKAEKTNSTTSYPPQNAAPAYGMPPAPEPFVPGSDDTGNEDLPF